MLYLLFAFFAFVNAGRPLDCTDDPEDRNDDYTLTVEATPAQFVPGHTVYKFYVNLVHENDKFSAVFGDDEHNLIVNTPAGAFNSEYVAGWSATGINSEVAAMVPEMLEDSYATIGLTGPADTPGLSNSGDWEDGGEHDPGMVESSDEISEYFTKNGATALNVNSRVGASWFVLNSADNALPDADLKVLIMQITTAGDIYGSINFQVFPNGVGHDGFPSVIEFHGAGTFQQCQDQGAEEIMSSAFAPTFYLAAFALLFAQFF